MAKLNGYSARESPLRGDDFRIFLAPQGAEENLEVFKEKSSTDICCGSGIVMGRKQREIFNSLLGSDRKNLKIALEKLDAVKNLDFFKVDDDGENFSVTMRCEIKQDQKFDDAFEACVNKINYAGYCVEEEWENFFSSL